MLALNQVRVIDTVGPCRPAFGIFYTHFPFFFQRPFVRQRDSHYE